MCCSPHWSSVTCFLKQAILDQMTKERVLENIRKRKKGGWHGDNVSHITVLFPLWPDSQSLKDTHADISHAFIRKIYSCKLNLWVTLTRYWLPVVWWWKHWALHLAPGNAINMDFVFVNCFYPRLPGLLSTTKMNLQVLKPTGYLIHFSGKPKKEWLTLPLAWFVNCVRALGVAAAASCALHKFQMFH